MRYAKTSEYETCMENCCPEFHTAARVVTMSSLELVEFINSQRGEGEAELRHDNFMAKVPQVLGEEGALNFKGTYRDVQNNSNSMSVCGTLFWAFHRFIFSTN